MSTLPFRTCALSAALLVALAFSGCAQEVSHSESNKPGWFGGRTQKESTVYRNADGTTSTESSSRTSQ